MPIGRWLPKKCSARPSNGTQRWESPPSTGIFRRWWKKDGCRRSKSPATPRATRSRARSIIITSSAMPAARSTTSKDAPSKANQNCPGGFAHSATNFTFMGPAPRVCLEGYDVARNRSNPEDDRYCGAERTIATDECGMAVRSRKLVARWSLPAHREKHEPLTCEESDRAMRTARLGIRGVDAGKPEQCPKATVLGTGERASPDGRVFAFRFAAEHNWRPMRWRHTGSWQPAGDRLRRSSPERHPNREGRSGMEVE